jgi:peroxiredoxin
MNSLWFRLVFAGAALVLSGRALAAAEVGQPAPEFRLTDIHGVVHSLAQYRGKIVVLEWVNPGCPVVRRHYDTGNMQKTQRMAVAAGVVWLAINSGGPGAQGDLSDEAAAAWLKRNDASAQAYCRDSDGKVGRLYGAKATPHMYVVDAAGRLAYMGAIDDKPNAWDAEATAAAKNYVLAAIKALQAGQPVEKPVTQAYGCAVKYAR